MRRTRVRAALLVVVATALAGIGYEVSRSVAARHARTPLDLGADFLPEAAQHIQTFKRIKVERGRTVWEITADDARYFEKQDGIVVREPRVTLFLESGRQVHIRGTEGQLGLEGGHDLRTFMLRGEVVVQLDDLELHTDQATYTRANDLITAPGAVTIHGKTLDVWGTGMEVEVTPQKIRLLRDVKTRVRGADAATS
ncbi:MAG TPA: LPS export ABC transporter periplasmic protein LptC [Candidatus Binatia bacterium]|nr:LPS export ABC transporter periplasmic protein LptC [Candidatus Binatia bacterium]